MLSKKRGSAVHAYEAELKQASDIFSRENAEEALKSVEETFKACKKLIDDFFGKNHEH
jgi:HEPN domain-containing protein